MCATKQLERGRGSVTPAKDKGGRVIRNVWRYRYSYTDRATGSRVWENGTVHGTKAQAFAEIERLQQARRAGVNLDARETSFAEFARAWQRRRAESGELARRTIGEGEQIVSYLCDYFGGFALGEVTPESIETFLAHLRKDKARPDGSTVKPRTVAKYFLYLKQIMQNAENWDYIAKNPCTRIKPPKPQDVQRRALSLKDARRLLDALDTCERNSLERYTEKETRVSRLERTATRTRSAGLRELSNIMAVRIGLATGMRLGEVFGLDWGAVDLDAPMLKVRQSLENSGHLKEPKTTAGRRNVYLDAKTAAHLKTWAAFLAIELRKLGKADKCGLKKDTPVIVSDTGERGDLCNFETWWHAWRTNNGFEGLKFHELRHTQATHLLANGTDIKTVQARLGHSDPALTLRWYAHAMEENDSSAAALVGRLFS